MFHTFMDVIEVRANNNLTYLKPVGLSENECVMHSFALTRQPTGIFICMRSVAPDLIGQVFERWTVLSRKDNLVYNDGSIFSMWECQCVCGTIKVLTGGSLKRGLSKSCGCLKSELAKKRPTTHGFTVGRKMLSGYRTWSDIKKRCYDPNNNDYHNYGGRGIIMCDKWLHSPEVFIQDMGPKPTPQHSIERNNTNGNYEPDNCRWATPIEQANNTRRNRWIIWEGQRKTVSQWARFWGYEPHNFRTLLKKNGIL